MRTGIASTCPSSMRTVCPPEESAMNQILALSRVPAAAVTLASVLVLASGGLKPSAVEADADKGAAASDRVIAAVRRTTTFGTLGIVDGQTVRLSAVRAGDDD